MQSHLTTILMKALLLVPVFFLGLTAGAFLGHVYQSRRYSLTRSRMDGPLLHPFAKVGAVLAVIAVAVYWQVTGR